MTRSFATGYVDLLPEVYEFADSNSFAGRYQAFGDLILQCYRNQQGDSTSGRGRSLRKDVIFKQSWLVSR